MSILPYKSRVPLQNRSQIMLLREKPKSQLKVQLRKDDQQKQIENVDGSQLDRSAAC